MHMNGRKFFPLALFAPLLLLLLHGLSRLFSSILGLGTEWSMCCYCILRLELASKASGKSIFGFSFWSFNAAAAATFYNERERAKNHVEEGHVVQYVLRDTL